MLELKKGFYVVVGTYGSYRDAEDYSDYLFIQGFFTKFGYVSQTMDYYVYIYHSTDKAEAERESGRLKSLGRFREIIVLTVN